MNDELVPKLPRYPYLMNVSVLCDVLSHASIFLLLLLLIYNLISFLIVLSDVNSICIFFVNFLNFLLCVKITLLTAFSTLCLIQFFNIYRSIEDNFKVKVCKIFAWSFCSCFSSSWSLYNAFRSNLLGINFESTSFVYGRFKLKSFNGITLNALQLSKSFISSLAFLILMDNLSIFCSEILQHFHISAQCQ